MAAAAEKYRAALRRSIIPKQQPAVRTVGLLADPGIAQVLAGKVRERLENALNSEDQDQVRWSVKVGPLTLPLDESGQVMLNRHVGALREKFGWEYIIYLTDIPQYGQGKPVGRSISQLHGAATLVVPSLGMARPRNLTSALVDIMGELAGDRKPLMPTSLSARAFSVSGSLDEPSEDGRSSTRYVSLKGLRGRIFLVFGMVRSNRPWRLVPQLSSALAGAAATGAFGVFYTSIWSMADYLSSLRLALITVVSILLLGLWLLFHNRLWERPRGKHYRERLVLYNTSTVLTVMLAAAAMYLLLFIALLLGSLVVIDHGFLSYQLRHPVGFAEYVNLAWLAASLGTLGGAIGSSFDQVESIQQATFSQREYERRNMDFGVDGSGTQKP
ncbi:hypothetical protein CQ010_12255 [Arthrobacter sp. MYb211]|uniref:hypothetical protein n=1 Tax=unclassified Arthrobacter TaxID=235627 RepID=UPI000D4EB6BE|nr:MULTISPECIES: hypothetical protein [unclassified Arthrobacter]PRC06593.1 hypothetical protein CQ010_12255 [Arthrobacter sp. MYb211]